MPKRNIARNSYPVLRPIMEDVQDFINAQNQCFLQTISMENLAKDLKELDEKDNLDIK